MDTHNAVLLWILMILYILVSLGQCQNPLLDEDLQDKPVFAGETVELVCDVIDSSQLSIIWRYDNNDVWLTIGDMVYPNIGALYSRVSVQVQSSSNRYVLQINDIHLSDGGVYECGYESAPGEFVKLGDANVVVINRESTPMCKVVLLPRLAGDEADEVDVTCSWSMDIPMAEAAIYRNGEKVRPDVTTSDRIILRTLRNDADRFSCELVAPVNSGIRQCDFTPLVPSELKVRSDPLMIVVPVGSDVQFNCTADGIKPIESYVWSLPAAAVGRFLNRPGRFKTEDNSRRLTLFGLQAVDDNLWVKCSADDQDGARVTTMSVMRVVSPEPTTTTLDPTRRTPLKLPRTTTPTYHTMTTTTTNYTSTNTTRTGKALRLPITVIALVAVGAFIVVLIVVVVVVISVRIFRGSYSKDVEGSTVNTSWVMSSTEAACSMEDDVPQHQPKRFGRKSRSSSRKFLYSRSSRKKNRANNTSAQKPAGVAAHVPPPQITPDPSGIYQNIPRSGSTNSLHSLQKSMQKKMRAETPGSYEEVKPEPPDLIRYKKPRFKQTLPGDDGGYTSVEDTEEVASIVYAQLDDPKLMGLSAFAEDPDFDPSILYAKVKK